MRKLQTELVRLTDANFSRVVLKATQPVVVDFWAPWCRPCKVLHPVLVGLAQDFEHRAVFAAVDVMEAGEIAERYAIRAVPTVIIFKDGKVVEVVTGITPSFERTIRDRLKELGA